MMETRPGQFPSSFPDTFKNFFSMLNEEEDHVELFSNLLEDKVIPKSPRCKYRESNKSCAGNVGRSSSFRVQRTRSDFCKHIKYCCLHQPNTFSPSNFIPDFNISDDEKQRNNKIKLPDKEGENDCTCANCGDSDTISTCSSSNNTTSYSNLLRHSKGVYQPRGGCKRNIEQPHISSVEETSKYPEQTAISSPSTTLYSNLKSSNDKINICSCKPSDIRALKSPVFVRRRALSIAATHVSPDHRLLKTDDHMPWGNILAESQTREGFAAHSSKIAVATYANIGNRKATEEGNTNNIPPVKQKQRMRTSSMPVENRKPRLADTRRAAIHCADADLEYYRLRSFSITSHGICNLGDSMRSRRSRSINSVGSTGTLNSGKARQNSTTSRLSNEDEKELEPVKPTKAVLAYKIAMLGEAGVGKTVLTYQFTTSEYICAYDLSLDDDYGQKTVSVLLDGYETDLEIVDHPACEMSTEAFCSTYNIDLFVVVYSVVDRKSFKTAEKILQYLKESDMLLIRGAILVGNKTDLERHREVPRHAGRRLAKEIPCKFIETSSGLDHNVNELLVGIVAQVQLNPQRINNLSEKQKLNLNINPKIQKHRKISERPNSSKTNVIRKIDFNDDKLIKSNTISNEPDQCSGTSTFDVKNVKELNKIISIPDEPSCSSPLKSCHSYESQPKSPRKISNLLDQKAASKMSIRTKYLLTSFLKFKRTLRSKRRNSNSCSDLFVI